MTRIPRSQTIHVAAQHRAEMTRETVDTVVIGAGVVGLAIARALACAGREVVVLERNARIGEETSSRNSEVIHAGIYYRSGTLKARHCVSGKERLYRYCERKGVPYKRCGKLIVSARDAQRPALEAIRDQATANGVTDLQWLKRSDIEALEPAVQGAYGLLSPSTGIVDSHALMLALQGDLEAANGSIALRSELVRGEAGERGLRLVVQSEREETELHANVLVNSGGLHSSRVASTILGFPAERILATRYAKGSYFVYSGRTPFRRLVYPLPEVGGLGVHATLDLAGRIRFGPDVEWVDEIDYTVDPDRAQAFYAAVRTYWPELPDGSLSPGYAGVRPKLVGPDQPAGDFVIQGPAAHGVPGLVNLYGIESPGLTAALALAEHVAALL